MDRKSLVVDIRVGESVSIDSGRVVLTLKEKSGQRAKLHFNTDRAVSVEPMRTKAADIAKQGVLAKV